MSDRPSALRKWRASRDPISNNTFSRIFFRQYCKYKRVLEYSSSLIISNHFPNFYTSYVFHIIAIFSIYPSASTLCDKRCPQLALHSVLSRRHQPAILIIREPGRCPSKWQRVSVLHLLSVVIEQNPRPGFRVEILLGSPVHLRPSVIPRKSHSASRGGGCETRSSRTPPLHGQARRRRRRLLEAVVRHDEAVVPGEVLPAVPRRTRS